MVKWGPRAGEVSGNPGVLSNSYWALFFLSAFCLLSLENAVLLAHSGDDSKSRDTYETPRRRCMCPSNLTDDTAVPHSSGFELVCHA